MFSKTGLMAFILAGVFIEIPIKNVKAMTNANVEGAWTCTGVRAGTVEEPIMYPFNHDGTFNYSSATTINSTVAGPVHDSGFHSRGGSRGEWKRVSNDVFNYKSVEWLYDGNGNLAGSFSVNSDLLLTSNGQLCSGRVTECPNQNTSATLAKYVFEPGNVDGDVTDVIYLLGPNAPVNVVCNRMSSGDGFPGLPLVPVP